MAVNLEAHQTTSSANTNTIIQTGIDKLRELGEKDAFILDLYGVLAKFHKTGLHIAFDPEPKFSGTFGFAFTPNPNINIQYNDALAILNAQEPRYRPTIVVKEGVHLPAWGQLAQEKKNEVLLSLGMYGIYLKTISLLESPDVEDPMRGLVAQDSIYFTGNLAQVYRKLGERLAIPSDEVERITPNVVRHGGVALADVVGSIRGRISEVQDMIGNVPVEALQGPIVKYLQDLAVLQNLTGQPVEDAKELIRKFIELRSSFMMRISQRVTEEHQDGAQVLLNLMFERGK